MTSPIDALVKIFQRLEVRPSGARRVAALERERVLSAGGGGRGVEAGAAAVENSMRCLRKTKNEPPRDPAIPLLGVYPKAPKSISLKDICTAMFPAALLTTPKMWRQCKCPSMNRFMGKDDGIHTTAMYIIVRNTIQP